MAVSSHEQVRSGIGGRGSSFAAGADLGPDGAGKTARRRRAGLRSLLNGHLRRGAAAVVMTGAYAAVAGWWTPRGPVTPAQALTAMVVGLAVGVVAGLVMRSRWAILVSPGGVRGGVRAGAVAGHRSERGRDPSGQHVWADRAGGRSRVPRPADPGSDDARGRRAGLVGRGAAPTGRYAETSRGVGGGPRAGTGGGWWPAPLAPVCWSWPGR